MKLPPSQTIVCPVTYAPSSLARNRTTVPMSDSGSPMRPSEVRDSTRSFSTGFAANAVDQAAASAALKIAGTDLRAWFFILAFVCIGLDFRLIAIREAGVRPVLVFAGATVLNLALALILASTIFAGFRLS